jgi:hypothetical protein
LQSAAETATDDSVGLLLTAVERAAGDPLAFRRKQNPTHTGHLVHAA